jgi:hypothetical protein
MTDRGCRFLSSRVAHGAIDHSGRWVLGERFLLCRVAAPAMDLLGMTFPSKVSGQADVARDERGPAKKV